MARRGKLRTKWVTRPNMPSPRQNAAVTPRILSIFSMIFIVSTKIAFYHLTVNWDRAKKTFPASNSTEGETPIYPCYYAFAGNTDKPILFDAVEKTV
jgi:hypothetical protein